VVGVRYKPFPSLTSAVILVALTLGVYWPTLHSGFIWDDNILVTGNDLVKMPDGLRYIWFSKVPVDYVPATLTSFWLEWRAWGANPLGYHLVNVLLHALSAALLWRVLARLAVPAAWLAAAIFAVHPVNVQSVAWIAERKNTLSMLFFLLSVLLYLRSDGQSKVLSLKSQVGRGESSARSEDQASRSTHQATWPLPSFILHPPSSLLYWLSLLAFALALLSKTAVVPLPVVMLGFAWWRRGRVTRADLLRSLGFLALAAAASVVAIWVQYYRNPGGMVRVADFGSRLAGAGWTFWFYLNKALVPVNLMFVYPRWRIHPVNPLVYVPGLLVMGAFVAFWLYRRGWGRVWLFGLGYFGVMLLPVLGFLNIFFMRYSLVADHWQYFAIIGPIVLVAAGVGSLESKVLSLKSSTGSAGNLTGVQQRKRHASKDAGAPGGIVCAMVSAVLLLILGVLTWRQQLAYEDEETLWRHTLAQDPKCWMANNNLGTLLQARGEVDRAISLYRQSIETQPSQVEAYNNLGLLLFKQARHEEALAQFKRALAADPSVAMTHLNIGNVHVQRGRAQEAFAEFQTAARLRPDLAEAHNNLGCLLSQAGKPTEAAAEFREALKWRPQNPEAVNNLAHTLAEPSRAAAAPPESAEAHYQMAVDLGARHQTVEAIRHLREAVRLKPDWVEALNNLAWFLATDPDEKLRGGREAVWLAERAVALTTNKNAGALDTLAAAYAEAGQFAESQRIAQSALELARSSGQMNLVEAIQARLSLYRRSQPFRETAIANP
jgi:protein O-mannosyl-transferase